MSPIPAVSSLAQLPQLIARESIDLNKKLVKVNVEQKVQAQENAVTEAALASVGIHVDMQV